MLDSFRDAMAAVAAGVVVVAVEDAGGFRGLTATSFTSASLEPPLVLVCLDSLARTRDAVEETGAFSVSVLERSQEFVAQRFAGQAPLVDPTWREVPHTLSPGGLPIVAGAIAWFECRLVALHPAGDHEIAVGEVAAAGRVQGEPLILWDRGYWRLA